MKIGQVTFYNYNYGSVLQCYATQKVLSNLGVEGVLLRTKEGTGKFAAKFIHLLSIVYMFLRYPMYIKLFIKLWKSTRKAALKVLSEESLKAIEDFLESEINSIACSSKDMSIKAKTNEYVAFISGSDQIWNGDWFLINKMYFLRFAPKHKRIAWAPSFGTSAIAEYNKGKFRKYISEYMALSVRESIGAMLINELTGLEAEVVLDPVLLMTSSQWRTMLVNKDFAALDIEEYILMFFIDKPNEAALESINLIQSQTGLQIVVFGHIHEEYLLLNAVRHADGSPWNFLFMIDRASYVCTDSFHAFVFALLFHVQAFVFRRQYAHDSDQSSRIESILDLFNIKDRFIKNSHELKLDESDIDFAYIDRKIAQEREKSINYLIHNIKLCADSNANNVTQG